MANHIAIDMVNEGIDKEKSRNFKKISDTKKSKQIVIIQNIIILFPLVGGNIFMMKFKNDCYWVEIILLSKSKMKN